jgi:STE24 endopeptidase
MSSRRILLFLIFSGFLFIALESGAQTATHALQGAAAYTLSPAKLKLAIELNRRRSILEFVDAAWRILQLVLILALGLAARMRGAAARTSRNSWAQRFIFYLFFLTVTSLLNLPIEIYSHHISLVFGQSVQQWPSWFGDLGKSFLLTYVIGDMLIAGLYFCMNKSPRQWWFWLWVPTMASVVFGVFISPILIDPLFNTFKPLNASNPALVSRLELVVARGGINIPPDRMFLMKASEKVTGLNAYVTGIGASKRVVVWDTSIAKASPDEISFIFAHEMGHYVLNHIYKGIAFAAPGLLLMFFVGYHCVQWLIARFGQRWDIADQHDLAALVVIMFVLSSLSFFAEPIGNSFSRMQEHAADVYGQEAIHGIVADPQLTAQQAFQVLGEESLTDPTPHPLITFWTFSHPAIADRAAFAAAYDPWALGKTPIYFTR